MHIPAFPGGFVIPCLLPVTITALGCSSVADAFTVSKKVVVPWMTPNRLVLRVVVKAAELDQDEGTAVPALRTRRLSVP